MKAPSFFRKAHKGQSLMELAVSLVVLLVIVTGLIEIGRLMFYYIAMRDAAQEGAMYASLYPSACVQTVTRVQADLYVADPSEVQVTILINGQACETAAAADNAADAAHNDRIHGCVPANLNTPHTVSVTVRQPNYTLAVPLLGTFIGSQTVPISATMTSTVIRPPCPYTP